MFFIRATVHCGRGDRGQNTVKTDSVYKRAYNDALDIIAGVGTGNQVPTEIVLSHQLGTSRTTVRKVLSAMTRQGIIGGSGRARTVSTRLKSIKKFPSAQTKSVAEQVEEQFMEWMLRDNARPGTTINELELARHFGVATTVIREFLNRFQHFGLIEKKPNAGWLFKGFTQEFAMELFEIREMFELRSARAFAALPPNAPQWPRLAAMKEEHIALLSKIDSRYQDFSALDSNFHQLINTAIPNRFIDDFYDLITLIFHYHYQWNKHDERQRNEVAIREHLNYIEALQARDPTMVELACRAHLASAKLTLVRSTTI
jgi:DNA-binding GntR family transcriptional regulator